MEDAALLWRGRSQINGEPILAIMTGLFKNSKNPKTGEMLQTWIIGEEIEPINATQTGADAAICGDCPLKRTNLNACYVNLLGVNNIYRKYKAGGYKPLSNEQKGLIHYLKMGVRLGSYGDPAALPFEAWQEILELSQFHTGYTHQWKSCDRRYQKIIMASVESESDYRLARRSGWLTYRVLKTGELPLDGEIICLNQSHQRKCEDCRLCSGNNNKNHAIAAQVHGLSYRIDNFNRHN